MPETESIEVLNQQFIAQFDAAPTGQLKNASDASDIMIKRRLRENGYMRTVQPLKGVADRELQYLPTSELPSVTDEMEPNSEGAMSLSFNDTADTAFYRADKFVTVFFKISSPEFSKNIDELRTTKSDLRQVITDNALKDMQTEEDRRYIALAEEIVGDEWDGVNPVQPVGKSGLNQNRLYTADIKEGFTRDNYVFHTSLLFDRDLNPGIILMNRKTAQRFATFDRTEMGGDLSQDVFIGGIEKLVESKLMNIRHVFTIKRDQVPDLVAWTFTEPRYLGKGYELQPVTMYVEKRKDILRFSAQEKIGVSVANVASIQRTRFDKTPA